MRRKSYLSNDSGRACLLYPEVSRQIRQPWVLNSFFQAGPTSTDTCDFRAHSCFHMGSSCARKFDFGAHPCFQIYQFWQIARRSSILAPILAFKSVHFRRKSPISASISAFKLVHFRRKLRLRRPSQHSTPSIFDEACDFGVRLSFQIGPFSTRFDFGARVCFKIGRFFGGNTLSALIFVFRSIYFRIRMLPARSSPSAQWRCTLGRYHSKPYSRMCHLPSRLHVQAW
jgi:hypothetical protein